MNQLSDAEWKVMEKIWDWPVEMSVRDAHEQLHEETSWAYQTVQTICSRLENKGYVKSRIRANTKLYTAVIRRAEARRSAFRNFLETVFRGSPDEFAATLIGEESLDDNDRKLLLGLVRKQEQEADEGEP